MKNEIWIVEYMLVYNGGITWIVHPNTGVYHTKSKAEEFIESELKRLNGFNFRASLYEKKDTEL